MQCPSCRFENMPGLTSCGRCGSLLDMRSAAIDVHPPRASKRSKAMRRWVPGRSAYKARDLASDLAERTSGSIVGGLRIPLPEPSILPRLIVPGWAHIHSGMVLRGRIFLYVYLALLGLSFLLYGTQTGAIFLGLAISAHASSVLDILVAQGTVRHPSMMLTAIVAAVALVACVYYPVGWVFSNVASTREFDYDAPPFRRFDVLLINRWSYAITGPRRGDIVMFESNAAARVANGEINVPHLRLVYEESYVVDRIVGGPGDRVVWDNGSLTVNGEPVSWKPLRPEKLPQRMEIEVPAGSYLILPTTSVAMNGGASAENWKGTGLVPASRIEGRAYMRCQPLWRLWFMF